MSFIQDSGLRTQDSLLTDQQQRAVGTRAASVVLSSGAGCGKTHVLTARYLSHLRDDQAEVGQLVAITFTDRAARQMRERIGQAIRAELSKADRNAAVERWTQHRRGLETATICTIHSFCGTLLRQYAVAAGLDPRFDVLEEVLAVNLRAEALRDALHELLTAQTQPGEDLRQLVLLYGWRASIEAIEELLNVPDAAAWDVWSGRTAEEIADEWRAVRRSALRHEYVEYLTSAAPKIAHCLRLLRTTPCLGPKMRANVQKLLAETPRLAEADDLTAAITVLTEAAKVGPERAKAWPDEETYEAVKKAFEGFRADLPEKLAAFTDDPDGVEAEVIASQRFLRVAGACRQAFQQRKRRAGVLDFQDLLVMARDLLRDRRDVREAVQRRFRFVLIDELQDTDPVQMELVEHLCGAGLTHGKLFAVGDAKQSIYRFRGADVSLFQGLRRRVPDAGRQALSVNFRSQPQLLHFANALLGQHLPEYEPLRPHRPQANSGPCVEFLWSRKGEKENVTEGRRREAEAIARHIARMVGDGERLVAEDGSLRPARAGDVVLLFRAMSNVAIYEAALRHHGLDYYLVGGRAFFAQQEIYDLLNLLRTLENPQDAVGLAGTLRSPFGCLSDESLTVLARHPDGLWAGLHDRATRDRLPADQRPTAERAGRFLDDWRAVKDRLPIAGLLNRAFADSGYDAALQLEFLGDRKLANLWKLVDLARTFDRSGLFGLADFIARLGELVQAQPREEQAATQPEKADVVRLMTIHQAKGLEFPVVVLPDLAAAPGGSHLPVAVWDAELGCVVRPPADDDPPPFSGFGWELRRAKEAVADWREDLRTLYVACTRPMDYLVLSAALPDPFKPTNAAIATLAERFDLTMGRCLDASIPEDERPRVRVEDIELAEPVEVRRRPAVAVEPLTAADAAAVAPVSVCWPEQGLLPLAVLERVWEWEDRQTRELFADAAPVEAADGERTMGPRERVLRAVLAAWDFADADGWRPLLAAALESEPSLTRSTRQRGELRHALELFAASETRRHLAGAVECHRDAEFLLAWPVPGETGPTLTGTIDVLWRDADGRWHLRAFVTDESAGDALSPALWLLARAVQVQLGAMPASVGLYSFTYGRAVTAAADEESVRRAVGRTSPRPSATTLTASHNSSPDSAS